MGVIGIGLVDRHVLLGRAWGFDLFPVREVFDANAVDRPIGGGEHGEQGAVVSQRLTGLGDPPHGAEDEAAHRIVVGILGQFDVDQFIDVVDVHAGIDFEQIFGESVDRRLVGLVSNRALMRILARGDGRDAVAVRDIMKADPVSISPETSSIEAIELMRVHRVGCLPVVRDGVLVGIVTEHDFVQMAAGLLDRWLREE